MYVDIVRGIEAVALVVGDVYIDKEEIAFTTPKYIAFTLKIFFYK